MRSARVVLVALASLPALLPPMPLPALEFECSVPGDTRFLRVEIPGERHLCEVSVTREGGDGERRVLWYADNDTLFCSAKAYELRDKYVERWSFECSAWPDRDGIDRLSARQRMILDEQLKSLLGRGRADGGGAAVEGVRAAASTALDERPGLLALQFFLADGTDRVHIVADDGARPTVLAEANGLAARIDPVDGFVVEGAFVDSISASGALGVIALLVPENAVGEGGAAPCEGRQTLRAGADGTLVPDTPHRHVCSTTPSGAVR